MTKKPVVFWCSEPVRSGEAVMLVGGNFGHSPLVSFSRIEDAASPCPPSVRDETEPTAENLREGELLDVGEACIKVVVPEELQDGVFACRIAGDGLASTTVLLNRPRILWTQGDQGVAAGSPQGRLRVFGTCLVGGGAVRVALCPAVGGEPYMLDVEEATPYALAAGLPGDIPSGTYHLWIHNGHAGERGWVEGGAFTVSALASRQERLLNVLDYGARPNTNEDCTTAIFLALNKAEAIGGGVVYFPRGRYRIDAANALAHMPGPLTIPRGVTLRGEAMELVSLYWPDRQTPLASLIQGAEDFKVEELTLYCQGVHHNVISGIGPATISRVRIRANYHYMTVGDNKPFHGRTVPSHDIATMGAAIFFRSGRNVKVLDCDIMHTHDGIALDHVRGVEIARNRIRYGGCHMCVHGGEGIVFERNDFQSLNLRGFGGSWGTYYQAPVARNFYCAYNVFRDIYAGDRECFTFDGHGTAYYGSVARAEGLRLTLAGDPVWGFESKDMVRDAHDTTLYVIAGTGVGQYRWIRACEGRQVELDRPWEIVPDESSIVAIGNFIGRLLYIGNEIHDAGSFCQLYPPNCECVVAGNRSHRGGNLNVLGSFSLKLPWKGIRVEPCWFNQMLDNEVVEGNGWGGYESVVNGFLGGESFLDISGGGMLGPDAPVIDALPAITRFQVVRRHHARNNSYIRVTGNATADVLVEACEIAHNDRGIQVGAVRKVWRERGLGFDPDMDVRGGPCGVVLRHNKFDAVPCRYAGNALDDARIIECG